MKKLPTKIKKTKITPKMADALLKGKHRKKGEEVVLFNARVMEMIKAMAVMAFYKKTGRMPTYTMAERKDWQDAILEGAKLYRDLYPE
jgi:hypothetical protein